MKHTFRFLLTLAFVLTLSFGGAYAQPTPVQPTGLGSSGSPYLVATDANLYWITQNSTSWGAYFQQTADIDASTIPNFLPIGGGSPYFTGTYDGAGYKISGLTNLSGRSYNGMFGFAGGGATLKNIKLVNENISGQSDVGGLAGYAYGPTTISNCYSTGSISSNSTCVGGLVGRDDGNTTINNCYSTATVSSSGEYSGEVGGLVGEAHTNTTISNCYSTGSVSDNGVLSSGETGGLVGISEATVNYCYSTGHVSGTAPLGGLVGINSGTVSNSYWDVTTSGIGSDGSTSGSAGGTGESTAHMQQQSTYSGWSFGTTWAISGSLNNGYPYLIGVTDFSLPVQATDFVAKADVGSVTLSWSTQSEVNNAGFNVLREDPGTTAFALIASYTSDDALKGLGTSSTGRAYQFVDNKVKTGAVYNYKIQSVSPDGATKDEATLKVTVKTSDIPKDYALYQNYPNPFNPGTTIRFDLKQQSTVTLEIYNVLGQKVLYRYKGIMDAGGYNEAVDMSQFASGVYYYRIMAQRSDGERFVEMKKAMLLK